jgi:hypothetical protein
MRPNRSEIEECRQHELECRRLAEQTRDPDQRLRLLRLADYWHRHSERAKLPTTCAMSRRQMRARSAANNIVMLICRRPCFAEIARMRHGVGPMTDPGESTMKKATATSKKRKSASEEAKVADSPSQLIDAKIAALDDWRGEMLSRVRELIKEAAPAVVEEVKWRKPSNPAGVPVWSHDGIICTGETYKDKVKLTFANGASLDDPSGLFNSSLDGNVRRAIDIHEGDKINEKALKALIRAAVTLNTSKA